MGWTTGTDVDAADPGAVAAGAEPKRLGARRPASAMPPARARYRNREEQAIPARQPCPRCRSAGAAQQGKAPVMHDARPFFDLVGVSWLTALSPGRLPALRSIVSAPLRP
jgi:hypothetical protein